MAGGATASADPEGPARPVPKGIDGWLIAALFLLAGRIAHSLFFFGHYAAAIGPISFENPLYGTSSVVRIADPIVLNVALPALLLRLAATHSWLFPPLYVALGILGVTSAALQAGLAQMVVGETPFSQPLFFAGFSSAGGNASLLFLVVTTPYMLLSRRVRNTFRRRPHTPDSAKGH